MAAFASPESAPSHTPFPIFDRDSQTTMAEIKEHTLSSFHFDPSSQTFIPKSTRKSLAPNAILIKTTHSGICFTDVHAKHSNCGLGHEGIGTVVSVGSTVTQFKPNDRVGWGWLHSSCGHCTSCVTGYRQYCADARGFAYSDQDQGAFGDYRIIDADFAYAIPETIPSAAAAPLMCAGASVYEALDAAGAQPGDRVGVVGIGGLGHLAVLFASAMGCGVTAISSGKGKTDDAWKLGADEYRAATELDICYVKEGPARSSDGNAMNIDVLLITTNVVPAIGTLLPLLARRATIVLMTIQQEKIEIPYLPFILPGHRLIASTEASRENHIKMLAFAARHQIKPWIETFVMDAHGLATAFKRLETGEMRYRGVLIRQM